MEKRNYCKWSEEELNIVIKHYMEMPASKLRIKYLPNRSSSDIYNTARRLGLKKRNSEEYKRWTDDEIKILKEYVGIISVTAIQNKYLPSRSIPSIYQKIYQLGY